VVPNEQELRMTFANLVREIESAGYFTSLRRYSEGDVLVCVSQRSQDGRLRGNSFLVDKREEKWYISTWGGRPEYLVLEGQDIVALCLECLRLGTTPIADIPENVIQKYGLKRVDA
jgi:hypothetical protein